MKYILSSLYLWALGYFVVISEFKLLFLLSTGFYIALRWLTKINNNKPIVRRKRIFEI